MKKLPKKDFIERFESDEEFQKRVIDKYNKWLDEESIKPFQAELIKLQSYLENKNKKMIILFEGRDAAGKGGTIRRVTRYMNEKHYRVVALGKPSDVQRTQYYFQRYIEQFPRGGEMVLFDRSWYNRAMVEPVFGFCTDEEYKQFIKSVQRFENDLVENGFILVKLYFSVTKEEQARRFKARETNVLKQWKLSEIDMKMQEKWDEFTKMKYNMLKKTHTIKAPWMVIRSDCKFLARKNAIKVILNSVNYDSRNPNLDYRVDDDIVVSGAREIELMEQHRIREGKFIY